MNAANTNNMKKAIIILVTLCSILHIGYGQSYVNKQKFHLWSWDNDQETTAWMRSTAGTTAPWGISFWIENSEKMSIYPNGQVSINGPGTGGTIRIYPTTDNEAGFGLFSKTLNSSPWIISQGGWNNPDNLVFGNNGPKMLITKDGNVGIGTTIPTHKLEIQGKVRLTDRIVFGDPSGGGAGEFIQNTSIASGSVHGLSFYSGGMERLTINTGGSVGIGTNTPAYALDVNGAGHFSNNVYAMSRLGIGTTTPAYPLDVNGNARISGTLYAPGAVGIGTTSTTNKLTVAGANTGLFRLMGAQTNYGARMNFGDGEYVFIEEPVDDFMRIHGSKGVYFDSKVGIGTSSPAYDLDINGTTHLSGSIGIGIAPQIKLDVNGNGRFNGSYLIGNDLTRFNAIPADKKASFSLWVEKGVVAHDFAVGDPTTWADYVFAGDYKLPTLPEVEAFIKANQHLPGMPSEATIKKEGYTVHNMNTRFLQKIEELTLYTIEQQKEIDTLKKQVAAYEQLKLEINELRSLLKTKHP